MTQSTAEIRHVVARTGFANPLTLGVLVEDPDYLKVYADDELLQVGVDYTVVGIGDANGVSITIIGAEDINEYVGYESFTALYDPVLQQGADLSLGGNFGRAFESALDFQNRQIQAVDDRVDRALKMPPNIDGDMVLGQPVDGAVAAWDADTNQIVWRTISEGAVLDPTAASIAFTPAGTITETNVQAAIEELDDLKLARAGGLMTGAIRFAHQATPSNPTAGQLALYAKSDNKLYTLNSDGDETEIGTPAGAIRNIAYYEPTGDGVADDYAAFIDARDADTGLVYISRPATAYNFGTAFNTAGKAMAWLPDPSIKWADLFDGGQFSLYRGRNSNFAEGVNIWRLSDRVFIGEAASKFAGGSTVSGSDDGNSWIKSLSGPDGGAYYLGANARLLVTSGERVPGDGSTGNLPYGIVSAVKTSKGGFEATGQEAIAFGAYASTDLPGKSAWAFIAELQRGPGGSQNYALEAAAKNAGDNQIMTPNAQTSGVFGVWMNAGGDDAFGLAATNPSTAGLVLLGRSTGGIRWNTGLLFMVDGLTAGQAILMSSVGTGGAHRIDWYNASDVRVFNIQSSATDTGTWYIHRDNTGLRIGNAATDIALFETAALSPGANDTAALGNTTRQWSDLFLADGGVINFNNGDVTITHISNRLVFAGASAGANLAYQFDNTVYVTKDTEFATTLRMESTFAGATAGPYFMFDRNSASPAANDIGGTQIFRFANSSLAMTNMASIESYLLDPTAGSEDGELRFTVTVAGSQLQRQMSVSGGVQIGTPTGGYMGLGTLNVDNDYYKDGLKVVGARVTHWTAATGTATRTTFVTSTVTLPQLAERVKAAIDDLIAHGLIGT